MTGGAPRAVGPGGRYVIERRLGAGSVGVVYAAFDRERQARVALKTLHHIDADGIYHLKREFRSLADVSHPNLVALHDLVGQDDEWFLTMELVDGIDFLAHVRGDPTFTRLRAALRQLAVGVAALHANGKLHRDIKPSNALVTAEGRVVLLDFGLVTDVAMSRLYQTLESRLVGTPAYLAPEQAAGLPLDPSCDWYATGALLYQALTGELPFDGTLLDVLRGKQEREAPSPRATVPEVPEDLDRLCRALLSREPAARPTAKDVLAVLAAPGSPTEPGAVTGAAAAPWVGRAGELAALGRAFEDARQGRPVVALVHGRSGVGKTALVRRWLEEIAARPGVVVLSGRCYERELVPYRAVDSIVDALTTHLARLPPAALEAVLPRGMAALTRIFPVLRRIPALDQMPGRDPPGDPQEQRRRAFVALRELLGRVADRGALLICIDDLQWGDEDSAALLLDLLRPPDAPALTLLACYRSDDADASACVRTFRDGLASRAGAADEPHVRDLPVGPLTAEDSRALALALLGADGPDATTCAATIAREAAGNAFFVRELVNHVLTGSRPDALLRATGITLEDVLRARVARLPPEARAALEAIAVAGRPLDREIANEVAGLPPGDLAASAALRAARLVRTRAGGTALEIDHDRIRETVVAALPPDDVRVTHARLAAALRRAERADPEALALHLEAAGETSAAAEQITVAAARADEALAFERAVRLYRRALSLGAHAPAERHRLSVQLGHALANLGRGADAAATYDAAAADAPPELALDLRRRAAEQWLRVGHLEQGLTTLRAVLRAVGAELAPSPQRALWPLLWRRARLRLRGLRFRPRARETLDPAAVIRLDVFWSVATALGIIDNIRATDFQTRHLLGALELGEPYRLARALAAEVGYSAVSGAAARRRTARLVQAAREVAAQVDEPFAHGWATLAAGMAAYLEGRHGEARALCEAAEGTFRGCVGVWWEVGSARLFSLWSLYYTGELRELAARLPGYVAEAEARGDVYTATSFRTSVLVARWLCEDDPQRAEREVTEAMAHWPREAFHAQHYWQMVAEAQLLLYRGDGAGAFARLQRDWERLRRSLLLRVQTARIEAYDLRGRCALARAFEAPPGERAALLDDVIRSARHLERQAVPWATGLARALRAGVHAARGTAGTDALYADAARAFEAADMRLHAAAARVRAGDAAPGADAARAFIAAQAVKAPARMTALLLPRG